MAFAQGVLKEVNMVQAIEALEESSGVRVRVVEDEVRFLLPHCRALYCVPIAAVRLAEQLVLRRLADAPLPAEGGR